jgi:hypothetical protein
LSAPPQVATTWHPANFASCTANCPVPPAAAVTSTTLEPLLLLLLVVVVWGEEEVGAALKEEAPGGGMVRPPTCSKAMAAVRPEVMRANTSGVGLGTCTQQQIQWQQQPEEVMSHQRAWMRETCTAWHSKPGCRRWERPGLGLTAADQSNLLHPTPKAPSQLHHPRTCSRRLMGTTPYSENPASIVATA